MPPISHAAAVEFVTSDREVLHLEDFSCVPSLFLLLVLSG